MADTSLVLGPGLELGSALSARGRLTVVADSLDVDGSWLLARMVAGALARDAGLAALLVFSEPARWEQWAQALRKAGLPTAALERRVAHVEIQEGELPAATARRQLDGVAAGGAGGWGWGGDRPARVLVIVDDVGGAVDSAGRICGAEACAGIARLLRGAGARPAAEVDGARSHADPAVAGVCVRVRSELVPAAQSLGSRVLPAEAAAAAPEGMASHQEGFEAALWAAAGLAVSLGPLPSGSAAGVTGIIGAEVRDHAAGPCLGSSLPFVVDEAGVRVGASVTA
ncbi:hypothetical protein FNF27_07370 [Cafeteria roenbergensis]|uniref:Uncharacterized protein n=1 Tax=Cafeteria roenbergensis TaxID=33653 RepID=A0A5A8DRM5_CAFRO|nr:hypothetical protein FNF27_07370 [Cafeteria roenbergensis]|mmetsp:Transcript_22732/g.86115  ORF Transcript_22732/g.86115 Transcript_22732/m.86115 type:complete len:284 (+) Transcript_22732:126-977(+)